MELGPHAAIKRHLEQAPREPEGIPTDYMGAHMRSRLEAGWAQTLDDFGIAWEYEPELVKLASGTGYLPDFRLPELATVIEVKGPHMQRLDKIREYAGSVAPDVIVLIGYPPMTRTLAPYAHQSYMQWASPLGHACAFACCGECGAYQWCVPRFSMQCRKCGERFTGRSHFAANGEMRFSEWKEQPYIPPFTKGASA